MSPEVNHLAHANNAAFYRSVEITHEIFGHVNANVAPALGGSMTIKTSEDLDALKARLGLA